MKVWFYTAQYPVRWIAQVDFFRKHTVTLQLRAKTKSLTFPPLSIARYSCIQLSVLWHRGDNENARASKQQQKAFAPGLSWEPGILPLSYQAPQKYVTQHPKTRSLSEKLIVKCRQWLCYFQRYPDLNVKIANYTRKMHLNTQEMWSKNWNEQSSHIWELLNEIDELVYSGRYRS